MVPKTSRKHPYTKSPLSTLTLRSSLPLGFTFSYPVRQDAVDRGTLVTWTKGFNIKGVEGEDVVLQLEQVLERRVGHNSHKLCNMQS